MAPKAKAKTDTKPKKKKPAQGVDGKTASTVKLANHTIKTKRSGRYLVLNKEGATVNGAEKTKILLDAKLISAATPKAAEEAAAPTA